ncbi:endonuclease/exonuclease/phosphatase family protein [bacterium]|nr:endonuclease/exonuclease/phosphatase family protein [bacterium]
MSLFSNKNIFVLLSLFLSIFITSCNTEESSDPCDPNPCTTILNRTVCVQEDEHFRCDCIDGYVLDGYFCKMIEVDVCDPNPCTEENRTTCLAYRDSYQCNCNSGYHLENDICVQDSVDLCKDVVCDSWKSCNSQNGSCELKIGRCDSQTDCSEIEICDENHNCVNQSNPCENQNCSNNGVCVVENGSAKCNCNSGFDDDGLSCIDINECQLGTDNCDENANCINTTGSFSCECKSGFTGSGLNCSDIDECQLGADNCQTGYQCVNTEGSFNCVEIDLCENITCSSWKTCNPNSGSCELDSGRCDTTNDCGVGKSCDDNHYCVDLCDSVDCGAHGECLSDESVALCVCDQGYAGDYCDVCDNSYHFEGSICVRDDLCLNVTCDSWKTCNSDNGNCELNSGRCDSASNCSTNQSCDSSHYCVDIDLCESVTCVENAHCNQDDGSCVCDDGFVLDNGVCSQISQLHIKLQAANISSGNYQSYDPGHGTRIFQGTKPDVVMIQEFNYGSNSSSDIREFVDEAFGTEFYYSRGTGQIPNGVISKWPIIESGLWDDPYISNRDLDWAIIDIPGDKELFVVSVHLHTSPASDQVGAAQVIACQIKTLKQQHPNAYYYIVGGDFNGTSSVSDSGFGKCSGETIFATYQYNDANSNPRRFPLDKNGDYATNATGSSHYDFVLVDPTLEQLQVPTEYTNINNSSQKLTYPTGLVFDSRIYTQTELDSYFSPVLQSDSAATNMQHMAVTRDFLITIE